MARPMRLTRYLGKAGFGVRFRLFSRETRITKLYLEVFINKIACYPIKTYAIRY